MKSLYFAFAVLALPIVAFAEVSDTMINQTSLKQSPTAEPKSDPKDYRCQNDNVACAKTTPEPQQMQRKQRFEENKNSIDNRNGQVASRKHAPIEADLR